MTLFPTHTREELRRSADDRDHRYAALGGLASFPFSALKHIARAAALMARDAEVRAALDAHVARGEARPLAELIERLGREGRLGERWSVEAFYREASLKKLEPRRTRRTARSDARAAVARAAAHAASEVVAGLVRFERLRPLVTRTAELPREEPADPITRLGAELATLNALVALSAEASAVGAPTWRKLSRLPVLRREAAAALEAAVAELGDEERKRRPIVWRSLKDAPR